MSGMALAARQKERHDVVCVVMKVKEAYVVLKRSQEERSYKGKYNNMIEHIRPGETPLQAAVRGIREEFGLNITPERLSHLGEAYTEDHENQYAINIKGVFEAQLSENEYHAIQPNKDSETNSKTKMDIGAIVENVKSNKFTPVDTKVFELLQVVR